MTFVILCEKEGETGLELIAKARSIAPDAHIIALCEEGTQVMGRIAACGANEAALLPWQEDDCAQAQQIASALEALAPDAALFPATIRGRFLSAWVGAKLQTGLTADCTDLRITPEGFLQQIRPAFGGNLTAEILCRTRRPQLASVRPGVFPITESKTDSKTISTRLLELPKAIPMLKRCAFRSAENNVSLQGAKVIVSGGKGLGSAKGFEKLTELASLLGGTVGATRSAVDAGWISYPHQIGQTGVVVHPDLYIAVGISGLIQHTVGMSASKTVIAINTDRNAPIFRCADYGIVSDWEPAVDAMIQSIKK